MKPGRSAAMSLTIYQYGHSPYCIPITQALTAGGIAFETIEVAPHTREEVIRASGGKFYQVPLLVDGRRVVGESSGASLDIARYVDRKFLRGRLFPAALEAANLILTRHIEGPLEDAGFKLTDPFYVAAIKDVLTRTLVIRHKERAYGRGCVAAWKRDRARLAAEFDALLDPYETTLRHRPFLLGDEPVYADFALLGVIGNATWKGWNQLPKTRTALTAWRKRLTAFRYQP